MLSSCQPGMYCSAALCVAEGKIDEVRSIRSTLRRWSQPGASFHPSKRHISSLRNLSAQERTARVSMQMGTLRAPNFIRLSMCGPCLSLNGESFSQSWRGIGHAHWRPFASMNTVSDLSPRSARMGNTPCFDYAWLPCRILGRYTNVHGCYLGAFRNQCPACHNRSFVSSGTKFVDREDDVNCCWMTDTQLPCTTNANHSAPGPVGSGSFLYISFCNIP